MKKTLTPMARAAVLCACALFAAGTAHAALQDRDLDGDTVVDAFYDTDLDITWLRNADVNGPMSWYIAVDWADNFTFGGYDDWRLPTADPACGEGAYDCTGSEMGHLWYVELGNPAGGPMSNTGSFLNLYSDAYWSGTEYAPDPIGAWFFVTTGGKQIAGGKFNPFYAMAVRPGDVAAVPEPATYALMLAGLTGLALARRRRSN